MIRRIIEVTDINIRRDCEFLLLEHLEYWSFNLTDKEMGWADKVFYKGKMGYKIFKNKYSDQIGIIYTTYDRERNVPYKVYRLHVFL